MKTNNSTRKTVLRFAALIFCIIIAVAGAASAAGKKDNYPGPGGKTEKPKPVVTPKKTPKPTPKPTGWSIRPTPTPEPTPVPGEDSIYNLTVYYLYTDGGEAAAPYSNPYEEGDPYNVISPTIPEYTCTRGAVSGTMPGRNLSYVVYYMKGGVGYTILDDYDTPLGLGNIVINIGDCYE